MHGAHPRAAPRARLRGRHRHGRVPAAGDPLLLRRRHEPRAEHPVLGRGEPARHGRLGAARLRRARRDVPRHLRRRALRHRPAPDRRLPQGEGRGGHDRAEVRREPARVRDRRHGRGRQGRAVPREAVVGPGVLGHDQHRHLRARARGAEARPDRPPVRLLEGAVPAAARDGPSDLRLRLRRLLAGHREPRPVPAGELRRARRARPAQRPGPEDPRRRVDRRGRRDRRRRRRRGAGVHRQLRTHLAGGVRRPVHGARVGDDAARARPHLALGARRAPATSAGARSSKARSSDATATSVRMRGSTKASRSATR